MKRLLINQLQEWHQKQGRKPLILMGVRQVGKTYLLEQFGKNHFEHCHYINFEKQPSAHALFEGDIEPKKLLNDLRFFFKRSIDLKTDLIIFDEIQACPRALTSLKYFCEDLPELALCSAGSLLGLHLNDASFPVGKVDMLHLHPMTFNEFLLGIGDKQAFDYLESMTNETAITKTIHQHLWQRLKEYFITGGLPEVIAHYAAQQDNLYEATKVVRQKQNELIKAYYADIAKHSGKINAMHIDRTWRAIPQQLLNAQDTSTSRFKFKNVIPNANRYTQLANVIDWLKNAELIIKVPLLETIRQPLQAFTKENMFKLFMFDVGILGAMSGLDPKTLLDYDYGTYQGFFAENYVAQQCISSNLTDPFSWQTDHTEIEFILQHEGEAIPVEVKSGKITRTKSLTKYIDKYNPKKSVIFSADHEKFSAKGPVLHLPLYFAEHLERFL